MPREGVEKPKPNLKADFNCLARIADGDFPRLSGIADAEDALADHARIGPVAR